jgi:hypothetical protein
MGEKRAYVGFSISTSSPGLIVAKNDTKRPSTMDYQMEKKSMITELILSMKIQTMMGSHL